MVALVFPRLLLLSPEVNGIFMLAFWSKVAMSAALWGFRKLDKWLKWIGIHQIEHWDQTFLLAKVKVERPQVKAFIKDEQQPLTKPTDQPLMVTAGFLVVGFSFCWLLKSLHYRYHSSHILHLLSVLLIGWVVEGRKPCHHQPQIKHSSWPAIVSDLFIWYLKHRGGSHTNTVYASLCRFMCENWETISKRQFIMSITWGLEL